MALDFEQIESRWQARWNRAKLGRAKVSKGKEKFMMIFAYPGISGFLHVGHMRGFTYTDTICRYERMQGKEVLFPVGTHSSGNLTIAFARKVRNKDKNWLDYLSRNGCPQDIISSLTSSEAVIDYFNKVYVNDYWRRFGFLCDWERFTSTSNPDYEKFIQWQFKKLQQKDLLVQKPYFATACINCGPVAVDPSETDISKGGGAEKIEYTMLKFKVPIICGLGDNTYLMAATLRPETIFGQTNLWMNPAARYVLLEVGEEKWVVSLYCAEQLQYQIDGITIGQDIDPAKLIGRRVHAPIIERDLAVLPASFCDESIGTGVVTSVPSHAPIDWIALQDLKNDKKSCDKFRIDMKDVEDISPISIIRVPGFGDHPAGEIIGREGIKSQREADKLDRAKQEIYKTEFHSGIMKENCGEYAGRRVEEAKELLKAYLLSHNHAGTLHGLSEEVICRCGERVVIKRIEDQWFIRYSDQELTERSKEQAREMKVYPREYYNNLPKVLDWFSDRACARLGSWVGSRLPFDSSWIVEPISDSTLYPAYYIVSKWVANKTISIDELSEEFFDFVFLGQGKGRQHWKAIKEEFEYFYPLDMNLGGKEHQTVHFPVFVMNHVAILPEQYWPRGIMVNWWVTSKGSKISKSKGGAEPIPEAIKKYGVDSLRLYYGHVGSPHVDIVWDEAVVYNYRCALERIYSICEELFKSASEKDRKKTNIDSWLLSRMNGYVKSVSASMREYNIREMAGEVYFAVYEDIKWYIRRGGKQGSAITATLNMWAKMMCLLTPHLAEEIYQLFGQPEGHNKQDRDHESSLNEEESDVLCSASPWPAGDDNLILSKVEQGEQIIKETIENIRIVIRLSKIEQPKAIRIYSAGKWLSYLFLCVQKELKITRNIGEIMRTVLSDDALRGKDVDKLVISLVKDPSKIPPIILNDEEEFRVLEEASKFFKDEFGSQITVEMADTSQHPKARQAMPGRPAIVVE